MSAKLIPVLYRKTKTLFVLAAILFSLSACQTVVENGPFNTLAAATAPPATAITLPETSTPQPAVPTAAPASAAEPTTAQPTEPPATAEPPAQPVTAIQLAFVAGGFTRPTFLTHAFDGRLFVSEQSGQVHIIENGQLLPTPFLNIEDRVGSTELEQGLLSLVFHPDYQQNGRFYANYTNKNGNTIIARYQVMPDNPELGDPASEQILMTINQPFGNHNGGQLHFGPDGYLYIGMGDGGSGGDPINHGQNPGTLLGTLLRIDVDRGETYTIPATNPFANNDGRAAEVWAYGLRNPWRFSFDRLTGDLYLADVGQREWEEVNFQPAVSAGGQNYGWNILEGTRCYDAESCDTAGLVLPVAEYSHEAGGCSITGGYVYRGSQYTALTGNYFFADYCSGIVWSLFRQVDGIWVQTLVLRSGRTLSSFGEDVNGELYLLDHNQGEVLQIQPGG
jgi:glucose/arabinose dehydrogenase